MKTNIFLKMLAAGTLVLGMAACEDPNDWSTDTSHNRLFRPSEISITPSATYALIEFDWLPDAEYYILECNADSLYQDEVHTGSRIDTLYEQPYTLDNLMGDTYYFIRVRAEAPNAGITNSKWTYYEDDDMRSFKTDAEQIFYTPEMADRSDSWIRLSWQEGAEVTHIEVQTADGTRIKTVELTADEIGSSQCTVNGLEASTEYRFIIYNNESKRGTINVSTTAAMPDGDLKYSYDAGTIEFTQDMLDELAVQAQAAAGGAASYSLTIGFAAGDEISMYGLDENGETTTLSIPDGMSITFFGLAGASQPVLKFPKSLEIGGTHAYIRFENVQIVDDGCQYLVNQSKATTVDLFELQDCTIDYLNRSVVRLQSNDAKTIGTLSVKNTIIGNVGEGGYATFRVDGATYTISELSLTNSTIYNVDHNFIQASKCNLANINITDCTFYDAVGGSSRYFIDANGNSTNVNLNRVIFGMMNGRGIRTSGTVTTLDTWCASDCVFSSNGFSVDLTEPVAASTDIFKDPSNTDFTLLNKDLFGIGDPRWYE